jgi:hypothetical protein
VSVRVRGTPARLDAVWRPVSRTLLSGLGLVTAAILGWLGEWIWLPAPIIGSIVLHEAIFYIRGDRPIVVTLEGSQLTAIDRKGGRELVVDLSEAHVASVAVRRGRGGREPEQAFVVLHRTDRELMALRLDTSHRDWPAEAVDLDALQPVLGGNAGVLRGLASPERMVRQTLRDKDGALARALLAAIPAQAWSRVAVRVWRGAEPPVDFMGLHRGPPDAQLILDGDRWTLSERFGDATTDGTITGATGGRADRILELMSTPGVPAQHARLPQVVWDVADDIRLVIPAPLAGHQGDRVELGERALHTHLAEGALLVWWLLDRLPARGLPPGVQQAVDDSRVANPHPPAVLRRHIDPA